MATVVSAILANRFVTDAKLVPLVPMVVAISALSATLFFDKRDEENKGVALGLLGFCQTDFAIVGHRGGYAGLSVGLYPWRHGHTRYSSGRLYRVGCRRQFVDV